MHPVATLSVVATLGLLLPPTLASADSDHEPVPAGHFAPSTYASPHEAAYQATERLVTDDELYEELYGTGAYSVRDQMAGVLLNLHRQDLFPSDAVDLLQRAQDLWAATDLAYHPDSKYFDVGVTLDPDERRAAICINLEPLAWAVLAGMSLYNQTLEAAVRTRVDEAAETLRSVFTTGRANGVDRCNIRDPIPLSQAPLPLWALLRHSRWAPEPGSATVAIERLRQDLTTRSAEGGIVASGLFLADVNAQYLVVLQEAALDDAVAPEFAPTRDRLADFLTTHALREEEGELVAHDLEEAPAGGDPRPEGRSPHVEAQIWSAYALHRQRVLAEANSSADAPERLLRSLLTFFWRGDLGGFTNPDIEELVFRPNALTALFTAGPRAAFVQAEDPRVSIAVPQMRAFAFPGPDAPLARNHLLSNEWVFRYVLEGSGPFPQKVALPVDVLGAPLNLDYPPSSFTRRPELFQGGAPALATLPADPGGLFEFTSEDPSRGAFRLVAFAPLLPVSSRVGRDLQVTFVSNSTEPVLVGQLTIDWDARNVTFVEARFNDQLVPPGAVEGFQNVGETQFLPQRHSRLVLRDLTFGTRPIDTLTVRYGDNEAPSPLSTELTRTPDGREATPAARRDEGGREYAFYRFDTAQQYVRVRVADNGMVRSVTLGLPDLDQEVPLEPSDADPSLWMAALPPLPANVILRARVHAVDEHDNLREGEEFRLQYRSGFLREGEVVLLVFSAILFLMAAAIYVKMGRRVRR